MSNQAAVSPQTALVVEGGALRGIFSTGLLDGFLEAGFDPFDLCIGVSSGATNVAAYLARMHGRNRRVYLDYSLRPEFINIPRFLAGGHLLDLDWLWAITIREVRLDLQTIFAPDRPFLVGLTDVQTGRAVYKATDAGNLEHVLMASSAVPFYYRDYPAVDGRPAADGGVADAIPAAEAIRRGARRILVVRSRRRDYRKRAGLLDNGVMSWYLRRYPALRQAMKERVVRYNDTVAFLRRPPDGVRIVEVCPPDGFRVARLTRDPAVLEEGYEQGRTAAASAIARWNGSAAGP